LSHTGAYMKLGETLTELCRRKRLTLAELARRSGVPKQTLHNWTVGRRSVNPDQLRPVARELGVSVHFLLYSENDPNDPINNEEILKEIFSGDVRISIHRIERGRAR